MDISKVFRQLNEYQCQLIHICIPKFYMLIKFCCNPIAIAYQKLLERHYILEKAYSYTPVKVKEKWTKFMKINMMPSEKSDSDPNNDDIIVKPLEQRKTIVNRFLSKLDEKLKVSLRYKAMQTQDHDKYNFRKGYSKRCSKVGMCNIDCKLGVSYAFALV